MLPQAASGVLPMMHIFCTAGTQFYDGCVVSPADCAYLRALSGTGIPHCLVVTYTLLDSHSAITSAQRRQSAEHSTA